MDDEEPYLHPEGDQNPTVKIISPYPTSTEPGLFDPAPIGPGGVSGETPYTFSQSALNHNDGRPYMNSQQLVTEIMAAGTAVPDPQGSPGLVRYDVPGMYGTSQGTWQLVIDPSTNKIYHFQFKGN